MSISDNYVPLRQIGNGVTVAFSAGWSMIASAYARVYLEDAITGVQTPVTEGPGASQYTIALTASGFTVTFNTAPTSAYYVVIGREVALDQTDPYRTSVGFDGKVLEASLDKLTAMIQDVNDTTSRALKFPLGSTKVGVLPATPIDGATIVWSGVLGTMVNGPTVGEISNAASAAATAVAAAATATAAAASAAPNANFTASSTTGTNAYTCNTGATSRVVGQRYLVNFSIANTNTNVTLNDNGLGAANIRYKTPAGLFAPAIGDLSGYTWMIWDGTQYQVIGKYPFAKALDVASAATTDFTQSVGDYVTLTGTTGITAMTLGDRDQKTVIYTGTGLNITLGASLTLNNLATGTLRLSTNDVITIRRDGSVTKIIGGQRANGSPISTTGVEVSIASATTTDLGTLASKLVSITGTTTITSFGSTASTLDPLYFIQFAGALTLTHNGTSLIIPGAANITTAAGDCAIVKYEGSGNWRVLNYVKASGAGLTGSGLTLLAKRTPGAVTTDLLTGIPAGVKMVIISFLGLTKGGTGDLNIQIGPSGGVATSGYVGVARGTNVTAGMFAGTSWSALGATWGTVILTLAEVSSNTWTWQGDPSGGGFNAVGGGGVALSGALERILITDQGGAPGNFSAGSWQVTYMS